MTLPLDSPPRTRAPVSGFAAILRDHTQVVHRAAERAGFIADLLRGRATIAGYALFLRNLHPAYAALEPALARLSDQPLVRPFAEPELRRLAALEADLLALDPRWSDRPAHPAAEAYARAVAHAAAEDGPAALVGHAYARYLGDLSGGQILKPLLGRTLGLGPEALRFYDFPCYPDLAAPKSRLRDALDAVPVGSADAERMRTEAVDAFRHNIAVSEAVQASLEAR